MNDLTKLTWQCRRGTKELDFLLTTYLESFYLQADASEQQQFQQLIKLEDSQLLALFLTSQQELQGLKNLVEKIRHAAAIYHP